MDHTFVDEKSLKTLEDLAVCLTSGMMSLMTLQNLQVRSIKIGLMPEDMNEKATLIIWDLRRAIKNYQSQLEACLELLPDDFNATMAIEAMKAKELVKARAMTRKAKVKE